MSVLVFFTFIALFGESYGEKLIRVETIYSKPAADATWAELLGIVWVDFQPVKAVSDTGASYPFFLWKEWYDKVGPGGCDGVIYGCYGCSSAECQQAPRKTFRYHNGKEVTLFPHVGVVLFDVNFERFVSPHVTFGLVVGPKTRPWASLGLSLKKVASERYVPLMDQLLPRKGFEGLTDKKAFSFYLDEGSLRGELILGGDDEKKHHGALEYVEAIHLDFAPPGISIAGLGIGNDSTNRIDVSSVAFLDTGSSKMHIHESLKPRVLALLQSAGTKAVVIKEESGSFIVACEDVKYLPSITFFMKGLQADEVSVDVFPDALKGERQDGSCELALAFGKVWYLGLPTVVGKCVSVNETRIGLGKAK
ncbi:hypothetical protein FOZ63_029669 [Perkinsus olseni]|uniref:Peptidase A1 domain-containing protein n=1 Tax=Perkinsus olseni TaxID=32597 RepID=A0A7J6P1P1_PEROL|nr:hypothetical protein FOZ60_000780 [Perkinsus olseni]KAF4715133.1 hypothetical protein FOZ63_029669 [Perkinsus olseni]KAF4731223.1 hypothetical protein FOZ62_010214 [Perkinsus olseni]